MGRSACGATARPGSAAATRAATPASGTDRSATRTARCGASIATRVPARAVADDHGGRRALAAPQIGSEGFRAADAWIERDVCGLEGAAGADVPPGGEHLAPLTVETRDEERGLAGRRVIEPAARHGFERRHRHHEPAARERESLHGRHPDAQTREGAGTGDDREELDIGERVSETREPVHGVLREALAVRACGIAVRRVAAVAIEHRDASRARDGLDRQHEHAAMLYSGKFDLRPVRITLPRPVTSSSSSSSSAPSPLPASATPAMRQYLDAKRQHRDAIVLFRMGDFYEMFYEDALTAARVLELTLTSRAKDAGGVAIPMCGVPFHALDDVPGAARAQGLSRGDLRSGRGSAQGQGHRQARGDARGLAGHVHRRRVSRRPRAGVPGGDCAAGVGLGAMGAGVPRRVDRRVRGGGVRRRRRRRGARRPSWPSCGRASCSPPSTPRSTAPSRRWRRPDSRVSTTGRSTTARAHSVLCDQLRVAVAGGASASRRRTRRRRRGRGDRRLPARYAAARSDARARHLAARAGRRAAHRSRHAPAPERRRGRRRRPRGVAARRRSIARSRRWAAGCSASGCCGRSWRSSGFRIASTRSRTLAFNAADRGEAARDPAGRPRHRAPGRAHLARHGRPAGPDRPRRSRSRLLPRLRAGAALTAGAARQEPARPRSTSWPTFATPSTRRLPTSRRRSPATAASSATASIRARRAARRSAAAARARSPPWRTAERARTGHRLAQGPLQPRVRLLHRGLEVESWRACPPTTSASRRLPAASGSSRPRSRTTRIRSWAPTSASSTRELELFEALRARVAAEAPRLLDTARAVACLDVLAALADAAAVYNYIKPHVHDGDEIQAVDARHPIVERHVNDGVRAQRRAARRGASASWSS